MTTQQQIDATLMADPAGQIGSLVGGFAIVMIPAYILLRFAGSSNRKPATAVVLRVVAIALAIFLTYASFIGGGRLNLGDALAVCVTIAWAARQQFSKPKLPQ